MICRFYVNLFWNWINRTRPNGRVNWDKGCSETFRCEFSNEILVTWSQHLTLFWERVWLNSNDLLIFYRILFGRDPSTCNRIGSSRLRQRPFWSVSFDMKSKHLESVAFISYGEKNLVEWKYSAEFTANWIRPRPTGTVRDSFEALQLQFKKFNLNLTQI